MKALLALRSAMPTEIKRYLDSSLQRNTISRRAVTTALSALHREGMVDNVNGKYSIHDRIRSDFKSFGPGFCQYALWCMLGRHHPLIAPMRKSLEIMVQIYGVFVLYCLIQAAWSAKAPKSQELTRKEKNKVAKELIEAVINPMWMLEYFLAWAENQPEDAEALKLLGSLQLSDEGLPIIPTSLTIPSIRDYSARRWEKFLQKKDQYELNEHKIRMMLNALKEVYPSQYSDLIQARKGTFDNPKVTRI